MIYHFDSLPIHPHPEPLESLTSYVMRLAYSNHVFTIDAVSLIFFPSQDRRVARSLNDYGTLAVHDLCAVANLTECEFESLTFIPLGHKFGRSSHPQALSRFLKDAVSKSLRWCPQCLAETPYYRLPWRFLSLTGCPTHRCSFLDACPECGALLSTGKTKGLLGQRLLQAAIVYEELEYLLTYEPRKIPATEIASAIGSRLKAQRLQCGLTANDIVEKCNLTLSAVEGIERGDTVNRGASFKDYVQYANSLGIRLSTVLADVRRSENAQPQTAQAIRIETYRCRVNEAVEQLASNGRQISQRSVSALTGISRHTLRKYQELLPCITPSQLTPKE